ncbi:MAG: bifunctional 4-hydroxy-2-oxoglutarate aldolase/2-dehydro-3-deoxy-phosphogluconate aldolase [Lysobacteraceae bacterium]
MSPEHQHGLQTLLETAPVLPVLAIDRLDDAVPLARCLVDAGLPVLEVTLRTPVALEAIAVIAAAVPGAVVGAGTVLEPNQLAATATAGARFAISPGASEALYRAGRTATIPLLPGVATATEVMAGLAAGWRHFKFFPAAAAGGVAALKAFVGPFPRARFCPTGGIDPSNLADYLALPNVLTVGGSWMVPAEALATGDWARVARLAAEAVAATR